jgi:glutathione S-transferase
MMKLYYKPGACSLASHIILREIGEDFELDRVDTVHKKTESGADYLKINPKGYVPLLQLDSGETISEGVAILQYIADQHPEAGLVPESGTLQRARLHEHLNYIASELHKSFSPFFAPSSTDEDRQKVKTSVAPKLDHFESIFSDGRKYLLGDKFSVADAYLFVVTRWTKPTGIDLDKWPNLATFMERVAAREHVKEAMRVEGLIK